MEKITLKIDGMMCGMCESHVNDAIRNAFKVSKVTSSHSKGTTVFETEESISDEAIKAVIDKTGYTLNGIERSEAGKKGLFGLFK
ncbi:MAG: heavy-metal-associated domain-containing protein [Lachnospiraceae bacterium]|nr:heavy-metal-associated domain-containing protein [Lachnospiraceae bacterium]